MPILHLLLLLLSSLLLLASAAFAAYFHHLRRRGRKAEDAATADLEKGPPLSSAKVSDDHSESVRKYGWDEIEKLTMGFSSAVIGQGGFSTVYLATLPDSSLAAVKVHRDSERLHRAFEQELEVLLQARHGCIVKLLGYCGETEDGALVFEYVPNGTLHEKLHSSTVLPWVNRMAIALQVAEALDYLHESCELQIVHGDIKPSNILIDDRLNSKLCDFGSARMGFSSTVLPKNTSNRGRHSMVGSPGYTDPHYLRTGIMSKKSDVYSFGVVLLELMTGAEAFCSVKQQMLTAVAAPVLREASTRAGEMVDDRLGGVYHMDEAAAVASLVASCVGEQPSLRPSMAEVVRVLREKASSSISAVDSRNKDGDEKKPTTTPPLPPL